MEIVNYESVLLKISKIYLLFMCNFVLYSMHIKNENTYVQSTHQIFSKLINPAQKMCQAIPTKTMCFLALAVQLSQAAAYTPGTSAACYAHCIANCTTYEPFLCKLEFIPGIFLIAGTGAAACAIGTGLGYGLNYVFEYMKDKEKTDQILSENSLLIQ